MDTGSLLNAITRRLALARSADASAAARMTLPPFAAAQLTPDGRSLVVTYDPQQIGLREIEALASSAGLMLSKGFLARLKRGWAAFQDDNQRDHSKIVHHCCSTPPSEE